VGTLAIRPVVNMNANASPPGGGSAGGILSQRYGANYTGGINVLTPFKNARYDSLQSSVIWRWAAGSNLRMSYTWSKALDYAENEDLGSLAFPYPTYWSKNYGFAGFDRTNNVEIAGVVALPFGKGQAWLQSGVGGAILGGWLINPIVSMMSGIPFTVSAASGTLNANGSGQTADLVSNFRIPKGRPPRTGVTCTVGDPSCSYFSASSFAAPYIPVTGGVAVNPHYGNTKRNEFRGPGYFNANLSIVRDFKIKEAATIRVRGDAFGLTNTPHFANPNATCPSSGLTADPNTGSGQLCTTSASSSTFGVITSTSSPGGFFGPDSGARQLWLGFAVLF
jgi:hypothetical protein